MSGRRTVFGEIADVYDDVRPGYPDELVTEVLEYAAAGTGVAVDRAVEIGAGTGLATRGFVDRGVAVCCVEADAEMAGVLARRFAGSPGVRVEVSRFEDWSPPSAGVPLLYCAQAWHWMPAERRCGLALGALCPGGAVALFSHKYRFADAGLEAAVVRVFEAHAPSLVGGDVPGGPVGAPEDRWFARELAGSGLFEGVRARRFDRTVRLGVDRYVALMGTFSPFLALPVRRRSVVAEALAEVVCARGGVVEVWLDTVLAVGRSPVCRPIG